MKPALTLALCALLLSCGASEPQAPQQGGLPPGDRALCQDPQALRLRVDPEAWSTRPANNFVRVQGDVAWVVQSGSNTIGRLALDTGAWEPDFVDVSADGQGRNPWDLAAYQGRLYITNLLTDTITVADASTGQLLGELGDLGLVAPGTPAAGQGLLVVPGTGFVYPDYGPSQIVALRVLEQAPWLEPVALLEPSGVNTGWVSFDERRGRFYAVSTGARSQDAASGVFGASSPGAVDVLDAQALLRGEGQRAMLGSISLSLAPGELRAGSPRSLVLGPEGRYGYLPSSTAPHLYKVDLESLALLRGPEDPIEVYVGEGNQLTGLAFVAGGLGLVTAFNQDAAYVFDPGCEQSIAGPVGLGTGPLLEGALDIAWDARRAQALVLMSNSSRLAQVRVE